MPHGMCDYITENIQSPIKLFADDTSRYITFDNIEEATEQLHNDLDTRKAWATQLVVTFNITKTNRLDTLR